MPKEIVLEVGILLSVRKLNPYQFVRRLLLRNSYPMQV